MYEFKAPDKRRPVLVLTRQHVIDLLHWVMVAPVTSTIHGVPSEVLLGVDDGLKGPCAVNLDNVQSVDKTRLRRYVGSLDDSKMGAVCRALAIAAGCGD
jgi:mRNA interferase MazF